MLLSLAALAVPVVRGDALDDLKQRKTIEAQRVEREFTEGRAQAYRLVRAATPNVVEATEKLHTLLAMVRNDTSLMASRRDTLIRTLEWDLGKVKEIAGERTRVLPGRPIDPVVRVPRDTVGSGDVGRREDTPRRPSDEAKSIIESRAKMLADSRDDRRTSADRFGKVMRSVDESAIPDGRDVRFPKDYAEKMRRRSAGTKMTAKEQAIMRALNTLIETDFSKDKFEEVIDWFRKKTKVEIIIDRRALQEVGIGTEAEVNLKLRASARTVLRRILADLNLAYVIKDEAILITSRERASQMTTTRSYYVGDLATIVDVRIPPVLSQMIAIQNINQIANMITQTIEPRSWQVNNPDAIGTIVFDPITMSLIVRQTAEIHYMMGGSR